MDAAVEPDDLQRDHRALDRLDDGIAPIARGFEVAVRLAEDGDRLNEAPSPDLVEAAAVRTRTLIRASRIGSTDQALEEELPRLMTARQTILAEMRRRASAMP